MRDQGSDGPCARRSARAMPRASSVSESYSVMVGAGPSARGARTGGRRPGSTAADAVTIWGVER